MKPFLPAAACALILGFAPPALAESSYWERLFGDPNENAHRYVRMEGSYTHYYLGTVGVSRDGPHDYRKREFYKVCDFRASRICEIMEDRDSWVKLSIRLYEPEDATPYYNIIISSTSNKPHLNTHKEMDVTVNVTEAIDDGYSVDFERLIFEEKHREAIKSGEIQTYEFGGLINFNFTVEAITDGN